ncbi:MAG: tyrosine-type recombinase/integrase [Candidatus Dormibacteria bacterium]
MGRRSNGEGTIYHRADGRWEAALVVDGVRQRIYGKTRGAVVARLRVALQARDSGLPAARQSETVGQFLTAWIPTVRSQIRAGSWRRCEEYVRLHLAPELGAVQLSKPGPDHVQRLQDRLLAKGLSPTSVHQAHSVLHRALADAMRWGRLSRNVAELVRPPRMSPSHLTTLGPEGVLTFLDAARGHRLEALFVVAVSTGMRLGELLGLRWNAVDFDRRNLRVVATLVPKPGGGWTLSEPKTARGRRQIALTVRAIEALRQRRISQEGEREAVGAEWTDDTSCSPALRGSPSRGSTFFVASSGPC